MRMTGQNDIDAGDTRGKLAVNVEPVVGKQNDELRAGPARLVDLRANLLFADAE